MTCRSLSQMTWSRSPIGPPVLSNTYVASHYTLSPMSAPVGSVAVRRPADPPFVRTTGFPNWNRYAAVNDEFIDDPHERRRRAAAGQPDVFGMGNLRIAYLHNLLARLARRSW